MIQAIHESNLVGEESTTSPGWYNCRVLMAGPAEDGVIYISLRNQGSPEFTHWFKAHPDMQKEMLSVALTAITANLPVSVAPKELVDYGQIDRMYLVSPQ